MLTRHLSITLNESWLFRLDPPQNGIPVCVSLYLDMMDTQHLLHAAIKDNNFDLRLMCWKRCLPLFFSFNKQNYARYASYYVQSLELLESTHPGAKNLIVEQGISVQRSEHTVKLEMFAND